SSSSSVLFFFNATPPPDIYTLSLHDALPISLFVAVNAINGMKAQVGNGYLSQIIMGFNQEILVENLPNISALGPKTIDIKPRFWFNPTLSYPFFMVPGILVILVTMVGGYMTALNIVKEKETGTIDQINVDRKSTRLNSSHVKISYAVL